MQSRLKEDKFKVTNQCIFLDVRKLMTLCGMMACGLSYWKWVLGEKYGK